MNGLEANSLISEADSKIMYLNWVIEFLTDNSSIFKDNEIVFPVKQLESVINLISDKTESTRKALSEFQVND